MDGFERASSEQAALALIRAGNHRGAEARLRTMLAAEPNDPRALALLAHCRFEDNDKKQGLELARSAANLAPDDPLVRSTLTYALHRAGKGKKAREEQLRLAEDAAAESPEDSDALFSLAVARLNSDSKSQGRLHRHAAARDLFDDAERFAGDAFEMLNVAHLRLHQWDYNAAASLARRAMLLDPTRADAFRILAECALAQKHPQDAYDLALEALRLSPGDKATMRLMTRARARRNPWLRPFLPGVDWIVEMDMSGLIVLPILMLVIGAALAMSLLYDITRIEAGVQPAIILSLGLTIALVFALVSYLTAVFARAQIRRDLRRVALPDF